MMKVDGIPVEKTDEGNIVTKRGRWGINPNIDHFPAPGDRIRWCPALSMEPRYIEHLTRFTDGIEEQPLVVHTVDLDEPVYPCTFCTHKNGVAERGIIDSDFELRTEDGDLVAYTCHACIGEAPRPANEYDLEPGQSVIYDSTHNGKLDAEVVEVQKEYGRALIDIPTESQDVNVRIENLESAD